MFYSPTFLTSKTVLGPVIAGLLVLLFSFNAKAQFPNPVLFNTATNSTGTGTLAIGAADLNWQASLSSSVGPWVSAVSCGKPYTGWASSPFANCNWISYPHTCVVGSPSEHSCLNPSNVDCFYKLLVTLPASNCGSSVSTPSAYCLSLDFMADNCVYQIFLNNTSVYTYPGTNPYYYFGYQLTSKVVATFCNNWIAGTNTIIVHVKSGTGTAPTWQGLLAQVNQTVNTTVGQTFTANAAVINPACAGQNGSATVTAVGGSGAYTYSWLPAGGTSSVLSNAAPGAYTCIVNSGSLCSTAKLLTITAVPAPTVVVSPSAASVCIGTTATFSAQASGGNGSYTYTWQPVSAVGSQYIFSPTSTGTTIFSLTAKDASNCISVATATAYAFQTPTITSASQSICAGGTATLQANGATSYTWLPGNFTGSTSIVSPFANTTYTILGANGNCSAGVLVNVSVPPPLTFSAATSNATLCTGNTASITLSASGGFGAYTYSILPAASVTPVFTVTSGIPTIQNYSLYASDNFGCNATASISIQFFQTPTVTASSQSICPNSSATLQALGASSYTWLPANVTSSSFVTSPAGSTTYTIIGALGSCTNASTANVFVPAPLSLSLSPGSNTACAGNSITVAAAAAGGYGSYSYTYSPNNLFSSPFAITYSTATTNNATVTVADAFNCKTTATVTLNFFNTVFPIAGSKTVCPNAPASLTVTGAQSYTWSPGAFTGSAITITNPVPTIYTVVAQSPLGCIGTTTLALDTFARPAISFNTFSITCGSLGSATVLATGGSSGLHNYTWTPTSQTGSAVANLYPGNYTVTLKNLSNSCVYNNTVTFLPLIPLTGTLSNTPSNLCFGIPFATASIALSGGSNSQSYSWMSPTGNYTSTVSGPLGAGINTISVTDNLTFCNVTKTFTITQPSSVTLIFSTSSNSVCLGNSINASVTASGGTPNYSYIWTTGSSTTSALMQESIAAAYIYSLTVTDANNCVTVNTLALLFVPNPTVTVSSATICPSQLTQLTAFGASTYSWSTGASGANITVTPTTSTSYMVTGNALACTATAIANVFVKPSPTITITHNSPVCTNDSLLCSAVGGTAYTWQGPFNFNASTSALVFSTAVQQQSGLYTVTVTAANSCTAQLSQLLTVFANPPASAAGATVCEGSNLILNGNYVAGASYNWLYNTVSIASSQNATINAVNPNQSGSYTLLVTATTGCTNSAIANVSVAPAFTAAVSGQTSYCSGQTVQLTASGGNLFYWTGPNSFLSVSPTVSIAGAGIANAGNYQVTVTTGPCKSVQSLSVNVFPAPIISGSITSPICENATAQLISTGAQSYTWQGPAYSSTTSGNAQLSPVLLGNAGVYTLTGIDQNNCKSTFTTPLVVIAAPTATTQLFNVCIGSPVTLTISGAQNYQWLGPNNFSSQGTICAIPALSAAQAGTYQVTLTNTNNCSSVSNLVITAYALALPTVAVSGGSIVCASSNKTLTVTQDGNLHTWFAENGAVFVGDSLTVPSNLTPGKHTYTLITEAKNGCQKLDTLQIISLPVPQNKLLSGKLNYCVPACNNFYINPIALTSATIASQTQTVQGFSAELCSNSAGKNLINASIIDTAGCSYQLNYSFETYEKPRADFYISPTEPMAGIDKVNFYNSSSGYYQKTWTWYLEGDDTLRLQGQNQEHLYLKAGQKLVSLLVTNSFGCSDTATKSIVVYDDFLVYVPNSFTPNGDGINDSFLIYGTGIKLTEMQIFNRWGQLIFQTNALGAGWDGSYKSQPAEQGVYAYKIRVTADNGNIKDLSGHVSLLK